MATENHELPVRRSELPPRYVRREADVEAQEPNKGCCSACCDDVTCTVMATFGILLGIGLLIGIGCGIAYLIEGLL